MEDAPTRRSGRQRAPNRKYTNDAFETLNIVLSSDSEEDAVIPQATVEPKDDGDFPGAEALNELEDPENDVSDASNLSDGSAVQTPVEVHEDAHPYASSEEELPALRLPSKVSSKPKSGNRYRPPPSGPRSQGVIRNFKKEGDRSRIGLLAGPGEQEILHIARSRDQWAGDPTLPRKSRLCHKFSHTDEKRTMESSVGWNWYYEQGGREAFARKQRLQKLSSDVALKTLLFLKADCQKFLAGPYGQQKVFSLRPSQCLNIDKAWSMTADAQFANPQEGSDTHQRSRWMLNVGSRIRCLDWAPNHNGNTQYLALAADAQNHAPFAKVPADEAPAFTPSPPSLSCIEVWSIPSASESEDGNIDRLPSLTQVLCTDWGQIKQLRWCPVPRAARDEDKAAYTSIGLLAGIWSDGFARVLDIQLNEECPEQVQFFKCDSAAFAVCPTNTISTCLAWLSASDLAIGHANGQLAIYDICPEARPNLSTPASTSVVDGQVATDESKSSGINGSSENRPPKPWLSHSLHSTLVLSLASAYPAHPSLVVSSSISGFIRLTSLRNPTMDFTFSRRSSTPATNLIYYDALMGVVGPDEAAEILRFHGLRTWSTGITFARLLGSGGIGPGCMDVGKVHSSVVWGGSDGRVVVTNPMRRILNKREPAYQQTIFKHEWVRQHSQASLDSAEQAGDMSVARKGMVRITEGYKVEKPELERRTVFPGINGDGSTITINEEETGVTAVSWNPNLRCGGWLAVAWGSGLLRVEDVSI